MSKYEANCSCGNLKLHYNDDILRTSVCHCFACQQRTGSNYGAQVRLDKTKTTVKGLSTLYQRQGDSGNVVNYHFCPTCGSTVYWEIPSMPDCIIAAVGCFTNPMLPSPAMMVYGNRKHHWVQMPMTAIEYFDDDDDDNDDDDNNDNDDNDNSDDNDDDDNDNSDNNDSICDNDYDDDDDECTTCGVKKKVTKKLYHCNRYNNFSYSNCKNIEKLCKACNTIRWKASCVKCESWDCKHCLEFDKAGGDIGLDFTSEEFAFEPLACITCKQHFCKYCSSRCARCQVCECEMCISLTFRDACTSCYDFFADNPEYGESLIYTNLCQKCATKDICKLGYVECPNCNGKILYSTDDDEADDNNGDEDEQKRKKVKRESFSDYLDSFEICMNPPAMTEIIHVDAREVIERAAFIVYERRGTIEGLYKDFQKFYGFMDYHQGEKINSWFISKLTDTYHLITDRTDTLTLKKLISKAQVQTFVKGDQRQPPHVFALLENVDKLDRTPAYMSRSISDCMSSMFAGNPVKDTEDFDSTVSSVAIKFPLLFSKENLDGPLLNDLYVLCIKQVAAAAGNVAKYQDHWKKSYLRLKSILLKFTCIIQEHALHRGITISSNHAVLSPSAAKLYLDCPFNQKDRAKALGARWDYQEKMWYISMIQDSSPFQQWL